MARCSLAKKILSPRFRNELCRILDHKNLKVHARGNAIPRNCSTKTRRERAANIERTFAQLHQLGYQIQHPAALKPKHIHALCAYWQQRKLAPRTIHGLFSNLREFCLWIGKPGMVGDIGEYCGGREHLVRSVATKVDLSWEAAGIDVDGFIERARQLDRRLGCLLDFQRHFGLRVRESLELRPWRAVALGDCHLYLTDGTKGGKHRVIPVRTDRQRQIIENAKNIVGKNIKAQLRWPDKSWRQAQAHFYFLMRKLGATHEQMGVSPHGLRHGFLQGEYEHFSGVPAPVKGSEQLPASKFTHGLALLATSLEAGHFRTSATGMYCGSVGHKMRSKPD